MQRSTKLAVSALGLSLILAACGGGSDNDDSGSTPAASSAASSTATSSAKSSTAASSAAASSTSSTASSATSTSSSSSAAATPVTTSWKPVRASLIPSHGSSDCNKNSSGTVQANNNTLYTGTFSADGVTYFSSADGQLRLYDAANTDCSGTTAGDFAINFNGSAYGSTNSNAGTVWKAGDTMKFTDDSGTAVVTRYIEVPYSAAATTAASLKATFTNSSSTCTNSQVVITNAGGLVLSTLNACVSSTQTDIQATDTTTVGGSGAFRIVFTRAGDSGGGIRLWATTLQK